MVRKKMLPFLVIIVLLLLSSLALASELRVNQIGKYSPDSELIIANLTSFINLGPIITRGVLWYSHDDVKWVGGIKVIEELNDTNYSLYYGGNYSNYTLREPIIKEPEMMVHPEEFEDTIYQGSYTTFTIVIEEISGEAPLKDVKIFYPAYYIAFIEISKGKKIKKMIPKEWIRFDKEYIEEIPAGGSAAVICTIEVPKDAKPGVYVGKIGIDAGNIPIIKLLNEGPEIRIPDKTITVEIHVMKDSIPPEIVVYSPKNREVVSKPYITVEGVVRDNIGVKRIEINDEIVSPLVLSTIGIEREEVKVEFKKEVQLMEGWNEIEIEAEDYAGNIAYELIRVKYEPIEIILTPIPIETIEDNITPVPKIKSSTLKYLDVEIYPKYCEASSGEVINYEITLDWSPCEWRGEVKAKVILEDAGFKKEWDLPPVEVNQDPPITVNIPVEIPNVPPLTYKLRLIVEAEGLIDEDYTELKIKSIGIPGFELILAALALASALLMRKLNLRL